MSVVQTDVVDAIGVDAKTGDLVLTITDHLEWGGSNEHKFLLQEKINTYLSFVEGGEVLQVYPDAKDRSVVIDVVFEHDFNEAAEGFLSQVAEIIGNVGIRLKYRRL